MELIDGCSLRSFRERHASSESLPKLFNQVAAALAIAHAAGIVHRDIKPENMMVRNDGYPKLVDFGLARFTDRDPESTLLTSPGAVVGTVRYMSPEQVRGEDVSCASDIFSLGIVMYEFAAKCHPFAANSEAEIMSGILSESPTAPRQLNPEISSDLDSLIRQMLNKDPQLRPTASEICAALSCSPATARVLPPKLHPAKPTREKERVQLWKAFRDVANGHGLLACLSGEPGIGKTTVAEGFLEELANSGETCFVARGRCSERFAGSEAYLPLLEALDSLLQGPSQGTAIRAMKTRAPAWFALVASDADRGAERHPTQGVSQEQLKRQMGALLRELSRGSPVVVFLDDLHWADTATIDLLAYLAAKFAELRFLLIITYRPSDLRLAKHPFLPLKLDLQARGVCRDIEVGLLNLQEIESYLASEFPGASFQASFALQLHAWTEGNPLFLVNLVSDLRDRQIIVQHGGHWILRVSLDTANIEVPPSIRSMIERKREKLSEEEQRLLSAASVQGYEFDSVIVGEVLGLDVSDVEEKLAALEQVHRFVRSLREVAFADRTVSSHYSFVHILYQNAFDNALLPARRRSLSSQVAQALERRSGGSDVTRRLAGQLAFLYEAARNFEKASHYFLLAAKNAARFSAHHEAVNLARRGLEQVQSLPESEERMKQELGLQNALGSSLFLIKGYGDPEVEQTFRHAQDLAQQTGQVNELFGILRGLCFYHGTRGRLSVWQGLSGQVLDLAEQSGDPGLRVLSYHLTGDLYLWLGNFSLSRVFLQKGIDLYRAERDRTLPEQFGAYDLLVGCRMFVAHDLWNLGHPDQARHKAEEAVRWAGELKHAYSLAASCGHCAWIYILRGEPDMVLERAQQCLQVSRDHGFPFHVAHAKAFLGWALSEQGEVERGIAEMQEAMELYRGTGAVVELPFMAMLLASAFAKSRSFDLARKTLDTALHGFDGSPLFCDAELVRWKGELLLAEGGKPEDAESHFRTALEIAGSQNAKSLELRAALGLSRALTYQGRRVEAKQALADIYSCFSEGLDTADLRHASSVLQSLG